MIDIELTDFDEDPFEVGDEIIFECSSLDPSCPRWQFNDDTGKSGIWANGKVVYIDSRVIQVSYSVRGFHTTFKCTWPNYDHDDFDPMQWWQDGYLTVVAKAKERQCECGAEAAKTTHSSWCPKYDN